MEKKHIYRIFQFLANLFLFYNIGIDVEHNHKSKQIQQKQRFHFLVCEPLIPNQSLHT